MSPRLKAVLFALFAVTGFSALTLQVVWQRVISMHAGVDLFSIATVVSAFLGGIGVGSLAGGALADRLGPRRSLLAFALSNLGIGVFAWWSVWLFYDVYRSLVPHISGTVSAFLFHFGLLIIPTTLMGVSLPLVSRGVVDRIQEAAPMVGRLYAVNTMGAGLGAAVTGWFLVGNLGFLGTVRLAAVLNLVAAGCIILLWRQASRASRHPAETAAASAGAEKPAGEVRGSSVWPWFAVYGLTGAVALGLEIVFFRVIDGLMRSNSYTFGHVLMLYLLLFGAGATFASRLVRRTARPDRWFLGLQFGVGVAALTGVLILTEVLPRVGAGGWLQAHFGADGYNIGGYRFWPLDELFRLLFVHAVAPLLIMGAPVLLMGASFPFVQALVGDRIDTLGRRTGLLLFANIVGNVVGTLVVGFVLIDWLGTAGTLKLLAAILLVPGLAAVWTVGAGRRRVAAGVGAVLALSLALVATPTNRELWAFLHSAQDKPFALAEDRGCVNALRDDGDQEVLFINAASQNGYPYDDFHVLIGLLPALLHPQPAAAMAVGLGIGATPYGMALDHRLSRVDVVEICGGEIDLLRGLAAAGSLENQRLFQDERIELHVGDGRKFLMSTDDRFDLLTVDVIRPQSAFSGSLYSVEFYELVRSRLQPDGLFAQWIPSPRSHNSATEVFPHVLRFSVPSYLNSQFFVASRQPVSFDREVVLQRLDALLGHWAGQFVLPPDRLENIRQFLSTAEAVPLRAGEPAVPVDGRDLNRDLFPRDEYFLNNPSIVATRPRP